MILFFAAFMMDVQISLAAERFEFFNGVRQMGMGGASIGIANDETSLLANPTGLGRLRNSIFTVIDPEGDATSNYSEYITDGNDPFDYFDLEGILDTLNEESDTDDIYARMQIFPSFVATNFGIGLFKKLNYAAVPSADRSTADVTFFDDTALLLGYNFRFWGGRIKFGFTGKYINRATFNETLTIPTPNADAEDYITEGVGLGADIGLSLTAPWAWLPSLTAVVRDVGNTSFRHADGMLYDAAEEPDTLKQTIDAAFSFFPIHSNHVRSSFTFEMRDVENILDEEDAQRRYHAGWELNLSDMLFIRAGMNQRYWTAGFELALKNVQMQIASYGEDIGPDEDPEESRRFVAKFAYRF
tara:strand:- start:4576 stop:5646 length:1071 start_codon:yes stop_codon:yes gene_type:complete